MGYGVSALPFRSVLYPSVLLMGVAESRESRRGRGKEGFGSPDPGSIPTYENDQGMSWPVSQRPGKKRGLASEWLWFTATHERRIADPNERIALLRK